MAKPRNQFEAKAREAAERIDRARAVGEQLSLLPAEPTGALPGEAAGGRGKGKAVSQLRAWLASQGYRMPEQVLAEMAGLASSRDAVETALVQMERVLAATGAELTGRGKVDLFLQLYSAQLRAADALMPYGAAKVQGDAPPAPAVQVVVQGAPGDGARVIEGREAAPRTAGHRPPPMPWEAQGNQDVAGSAGAGSDNGIRTDEASD